MRLMSVARSGLAMLRGSHTPNESHAVWDKPSCFAPQVSPNSFIGFASAISLCVCSGLAGVFFELMVKVGPRQGFLAPFVLPRFIGSVRSGLLCSGPD